MIDLHIHSTYSDGSYTVREILQEAENKNLEYISITDHDCVKAYKELENMNIKNYYKGNIIVGCEFKCYLEEFHKQTMINCAQEHNLYISGGTDFHGILKPDIEMGEGRGNLQIQKEIISDWINKIKSFR